MKYLCIFVLCIWSDIVCGQYSGTASVTQGRADKILTGLYNCAGGRPTNVGQITASDGSKWIVPASVNFRDSIFPFASDLYNSCTGAGYKSSATALSKLTGIDVIDVDPDGELITGFIFTDNYFELYINGKPVGKDKVPFTPFNSSIVRFRVHQPFTVAMLLVDWEENPGLGSEVNGGSTYHPGDGGMVAVFKNTSGNIIGITDNTWKAQTFYTSPVKDLSCPQETENERLSGSCNTSDSNNGAGYYGLHWQKPDLWFDKNFDDSGWPNAYEYINEVVGVNNKPSYTNFLDIFDNTTQNARFIWSSNIILDNEVIVRKTIGTPSATSEYSVEKHLILAPNPGSEFLSVTMNDAGQINQVMEVTIYNPEGVCMHSDIITNESIDTSLLPPGIYFIQIRIKQTIFYKKWIKEY